MNLHQENLLSLSGSPCTSTSDPLHTHTCRGSSSLSSESKIMKSSIYSNEMNKLKVKQRLALIESLWVFKLGLIVLTIHKQDNPILCYTF